jgi:hypothetical protein
MFGLLFCRRRRLRDNGRRLTGIDTSLLAVLEDGLGHVPPLLDVVVNRRVEFLLRGLARRELGRLRVDQSGARGVFAAVALDLIMVGQAAELPPAGAAEEAVEGLFR